jgi:hypothetical protein
MKQIFDEHKRPTTSEWSRAFTSYLMRNTLYLRGELVQQASAAADHSRFSYVEKGEELEMLAAADFARAEPILKKFAEDPMPRRAVLAKALLFEYGPNGPATDLINLELRKIAVDKGCPRKFPGSSHPRRCLPANGQAAMSGIWVCSGSHP